MDNNCFQKRVANRISAVVAQVITRESIRKLNIEAAEHANREEKHTRTQRPKNKKRRESTMDSSSTSTKMRRKTETERGRVQMKIRHNRPIELASAEHEMNSDSSQNPAATMIFCTAGCRMNSSIRTRSSR